MNNPIENFTIEFFKSIKSTITKKGEAYNIESIPTNLEEYIGRKGPYSISFKPGIEGCEYISKEHKLFSGIVKYLKETGKTTLLKIDFDTNPTKKIEEQLALKNCEISNITKKERNHYFSRFTFMTTFRYLNESEHHIQEIYTHKGNILKGNLEGYNILEGKQSEASSEHLEQDYITAKEHLQKHITTKVEGIKKELEKKLEQEITRIKEHYNNQLQELGGDLNEKLKKIQELEITLRTTEKEEEEQKQKKQLERIRKSLIKVGDDESKNRILKEQEFTIRDAIHKHSLNIDNNLINTTIIYYPVYHFNLFLKKEETGRYLDLVYDPLKEDIETLTCETCKKEVRNIHLCNSGHITCKECLHHCGDCGKEYCSNCLKRTCQASGKALCKHCLILCKGCGSYISKDYTRTDNVTGETRCTLCLRACLRCHGLSSQEHFAEAKDGSKVCKKCLAEEKRTGIMKDIFKD
jgi:hypothetical protein